MIQISRSAEGLRKPLEEIDSSTIEAQLCSTVTLKWLFQCSVVKVFAFLVIAVFIIESWDTENLLIKKSVKDSSVIYPVLNNSSKLILPTIKSHNIIDLPILKNQEN